MGTRAGLARYFLAETFAALVLLAAVTNAMAAEFRRAEGPREWRFPRDHGSHSEYSTEWWYATGSLHDESGHPFGFELTFFRVALRPDSVPSLSAWRARDLVLAHFTVTDVAARRFYFAERSERAAAGMAGARQDSLAVWSGDWAIREVSPDRFELRASSRPGESPIGSEAFAVDLTLENFIPPVLHGERGWSSKGPGGVDASHYYSMPRLRTHGLIRIGAREVPVNGLTWMDHEFFTGRVAGGGAAAAGPGWDWFSAHFDDGRELMLFRVRHDAEGNTFGGTLVEASGRSRPLALEGIRMTSLAAWTSPRTGIAYPVSWRIELPAEGAEVVFRPLLEEQEVTAQASVGVDYWEGLGRYAGQWGGSPLAGAGYVELTGYGRADAGHARTPGARGHALTTP